MSHQGEGTQSAEFLSWGKLRLSKAKLKAASNTSALLAGFAMVIQVSMCHRYFKIAMIIRLGSHG